MKTIGFIILFVLVGGLSAQEKIVVLPELQKPKTITLKKRQIFITENVKVLVYSAENFKLLHTFGKRGEGPGEFKIMDNAEIGIGVQISVQPDYILANSIGRISYFTREGKFIKELTTQMSRGPYGHNLIPLGKWFVGYGFMMEGKTWYVCINLYDQNIKPVKELYRHLFFVQPGKKTDPEKWRPSLFYVSKGRIILDREDGTIDILDRQGKRIKSFTHPYPKISETRSRIDKYLNFLKTDPRFRENFEFLRNTLEFPDYLPLIQYFTVDDDHIYVLTQKKRGEDNQMFVFDYQGRLLKEIWIKLAEKTPIEPYPYTIDQGVLYQLKENLETESWELVVTEII
jgi:hypothetical protein